MTTSASLRLPRDGDRLLFSSHTSVDEYVLLEVTDEQLSSITRSRHSSQGGWPFELRGPPDSEAVIVSANAT